MKTLTFLLLCVLIKTSGAQTYDVYSVKYASNDLGTFYKNDVSLLSKIVPPGGKLLDYKTIRFMVYSFREDETEPMIFWSQNLNAPWKAVNFPQLKNCSDVLTFKMENFKLSGYHFDGTVQIKCTYAQNTQWYSFKVWMNENRILTRVEIYTMDKTGPGWYLDQPSLK